MDIFTTALTRVVPTPIKSEKLKVKALVKDAAPNQVTDDIGHVENHESYINLYKDKKDKDKKEKEKDKDKKEKKDECNQSDEGSLSDDVKSATSSAGSHEPLIESKKDDQGNDIQHLDIFV